jgi:DNA mismatch repair protein MutH
MYDKVFKPTVNQGYVRIIEGRISSLNIYKPKGYASEVIRLEHALTDVIGKMAEGELESLRAYQNKIMTPEEKAAEAKAMIKAMSENRDKPSI